MREGSAENGEWCEGDLISLTDGHWAEEDLGLTQESSQGDSALGSSTPAIFLKSERKVDLVWSNISPSRFNWKGIRSITIWFQFRSFSWK